MVELHPDLADRVQILKDRLYVPENDATLLPLGPQIVRSSSTAVNTAGGLMG